MDAEQLMEAIGEQLATRTDVASMDAIFEEGEPPAFGVELDSGERFIVTVAPA